MKRIRNSINPLWFVLRASQTAAHHHGNTEAGQKLGINQAQREGHNLQFDENTFNCMIACKLIQNMQTFEFP